MFLFLILAVFAQGASWQEPLESRLAALDESAPGSLGVFVKRLKDGQTVSYHGDRPWYLSSTVKAPVAVALLKKVEKGELSLSQQLTLRASDYVDGAGDLQRTKPGTRFTVRSLLERMLVHSDSSAADMLIRLIGADYLNAFLGNGFGQITTILQVRYDAFGELHPKAKTLANTDFIEFKRVRDYGERLGVFRRRLGLARNELRAPSIKAAFERYYERGLNSASLEAYGELLEKLVKGELLNAENTKMLLGFMERITTGERRLKAGFPKGTEFAQKTGTQVGRICNMGVVRPSGDALVVAACVEKFSDQAGAENLLKRVGKALVETVW
jgi:beta-lactamase class A